MGAAAFEPDAVAPDVGAAAPDDAAADDTLAVAALLDAEVSADPAALPAPVDATCPVAEPAVCAVFVLDA